MSRVKIFSLNEKQYYCCADFGRKKDVAVAVISKQNDDGTSTVVATKVLGRAADFNEETIKEMVKSLKEFKEEDSK